MMNNLIEKAAGLLLVLVLLFGHPGMLSGQTEKVKLIKGGQKVDVMIGESCLLPISIRPIWKNRISGLSMRRTVRWLQGVSPGTPAQGKG